MNIILCQRTNVPAFVLWLPYLLLTNITFLSPHPLRKQYWESTNMALYPVGLPPPCLTGRCSFQNTFWPGSISVLNDLPTVCTLFLHPPLRSTKPFSSSHSRKELYIRPLIVSLTLFYNTFKSFQPAAPPTPTPPPPPKNKIKQTKKKEKVNPFGKLPNIWPNTQTWQVNAASQTQLCCWPWMCELKKVYDKKDASKLGRRGWKGSRVRTNLN